MGDNSRIGWTQATWNWVVGCEAVSDGCRNCYAAGLASTRLAHTPTYAGLAVDGEFTGEVRVLLDRLEIPLRWRRPRLVFVNSMSDLFHKDVPVEVLAKAFGVMASTPQHTYQALTKRHGRMAALLAGDDFHRRVEDDVQCSLPWPLPNVWVGVSVENQETAERRIPALLRQPFHRFLSMEPLLAPVDLTEWTTGNCPDCGRDITTEACGVIHANMSVEDSPGIGWVIVGGESGPSPEKLTRMDPEWAGDVVAQCQRAGVPVFFKQYGTIAARELGLRGKGASPARWPVTWPQEMPEGMWNPDTAPPTSVPALVP